MGDNGLAELLEVAWNLWDSVSDFLMATNGDFLMATSGDFLITTDTPNGKSRAERQNEGVTSD